jgi:hypothetical protein
MFKFYANRPRAPFPAGLALAAAFCLQAAGLNASPPARFDETAFLLAAGQADLAAMPALFATIDAQQDPVLGELRAGFNARFTQRSERLSPATGNGFIDRLVAAFRHYWTDALLDPAAAPAAAARLEQRIAALLQITGHATDPAADPLVQAEQAGARAGYGVLTSRTPPLYDLFVWSAEQRAFYRVDLTDGTETVEVVFIDGLISQGWRHFASLGLNATSGWTGGDVLYCVRWAYDTSSERFRVSYLKHEARHVADFRRYPGLDETVLEYRAKLSELAYAGSSAGMLLQRFAADRSAQGTSVHARANDRVVRDIHQEIFGRPLPGQLDRSQLDAWNRLGWERINPAARRLLERNTQALVEHALPQPGM